MTPYEKKELVTDYIATAVAWLIVVSTVAGATLLVLRYANQS